MNFCSIQDAWGQNYNYGRPLEKFTSDESNNIFETSKANYSNENHTNENHTNEIYLNEYNCNNFLNHLNKCNKCHKIMRERYRPQILVSLLNIIEEYKDIIVLILIGISIMLFFNLIKSIG